MTQHDRASPEAAILLIEDDDVTATRLQDGLLGAGYVVRRAGSAEQAMQSLKSTPAELILMQLMLPDAEGLILCSTLKATFPAPIIVLSSRPGEVDRALAVQSGALDLLPATVDVAELLAHVSAAVHAAGLGQKSGHAR